MNRLIINNNSPCELKLHPSIMNILFNHKREISNSLRDIKGIHDIDHVAIIIVNPSFEISIFSLFPSVEYNLIVNELWKFDNCFNPILLGDMSLSWWEEAYHPSCSYKLRDLKESMHQFTLGMNLVRKVDDFTFLYSFATRNTRDDMKKYYSNLKDELLQIGDYGDKLIRDIYVQYCFPYTVPFLESNSIPTKRKPYLKLIANNNINS